MFRRPIFIAALAACVALASAAPAFAMQGVGHGSGGGGGGGASGTPGAPAAGLNFATLESLMVGDSRVLRDAVLMRLGFGGDGSGSLWAQGYGGGGRSSASSFSGAVTSNEAGGVIAADTAFGDHWRGGLIGGYGSDRTSDPTDKASAQIRRGDAGGYAGGVYGDVHVDMVASASWNAIRNNRLDALGDVYSARYNAVTGQAYAEGSYVLKVGPATIAPIAGVGWAGIYQQGFTDAPANGAILSAENRRNIGFTDVGGRGGATWDLGGLAVTPFIRLSWRHAFGGLASGYYGAQSGLGDTIMGAPIDRDTLAVNGGLKFNVAKAATLGLTYDGDFGARRRDQLGGARLNLPF